MKSIDVAVIGGGLLGCFAARSLMRSRLSALLIEKENDVCRGISRANSAIIYTGYDNKPGSLKARMTVEANRSFPQLCEELEVDFIRRGSLLLSYDERSTKTLERKLANGTESGVQELRIISGEEAADMEPLLSSTPHCALYAPGTGTVNPWQLGIAAFENALSNGCEPMLSCSVLDMERADGGYIIKTDREEIFCRAVINCAGLYADKLREMLFEPYIRIVQDASDFIVFDRDASSPGTILMQERPSGKGISLIPAVEGNLLIESAARDLDRAPFSFRREARQELVREAAGIIRGIDEDRIIRSFAAVRPNPRYVKKVDGEYLPTEKDISSFVIDRPEPGFISLIGIKSPGLSCAEELGRYVADAVAEYLGAGENKSFDPHRSAIRQLRNRSAKERSALINSDPDYGQIVCFCENISAAEIKAAIARGADSVEAIKRRLGSGMGPCQGSRCNYLISKMLEAKE